MEYEPLTLVVGRVRNVSRGFSLASMYDCTETVSNELTPESRRLSGSASNKYKQLD